MTQYKIPKKWVEYLITQPETAMGCQIVDIYFKGKTLENVVILNGETFETDYKKLKMSEIEKIAVKEREELKETKKFQTTIVKNKPTKKEKLGKYYLIEEYEEYIDHPCANGASKTTYQVKSYENKQQLLEAILNGPKHGGKLIPAKGLELKLIEEPDYSNTNIRKELEADMKRREEAYRKTGDIV